MWNKMMRMTLALCLLVGMSFAAAIQGNLDSAETEKYDNVNGRGNAPGTSGNGQNNIGHGNGENNGGNNNGNNNIGNNNGVGNGGGTWDPCAADISSAWLEMYRCGDNQPKSTRAPKPSTTENASTEPAVITEELTTLTITETTSETTTETTTETTSEAETTGTTTPTTVETTTPEDSTETTTHRRGGPDEGGDQSQEVTTKGTTYAPYVPPRAGEPSWRNWRSYIPFYRNFGFYRRPFTQSTTTRRPYSYTRYSYNWRDLAQRYGYVPSGQRGASTGAPRRTGSGRTYVPGRRTYGHSGYYSRFSGSTSASEDNSYPHGSSGSPGRGPRGPTGTNYY